MNRNITEHNWRHRWLLEPKIEWWLRESLPVILRARLVETFFNNLNQSKLFSELYKFQFNSPRVVEFELIIKRIFLYVLHFRATTICVISSKQYGTMQHLYESISCKLSGALVFRAITLHQFDKSWADLRFQCNSFKLTYNQRQRLSLYESILIFWPHF